MKRAEIIERLKGPIGRGAIIHDPVALAEALGITVEPDESELPERLITTQGGPTLARRYGLGFTTAEHTWKGLIEVSLDLPITGDAAEKQLTKALVDAYNGRPRWRHGDPPAPGQYLVMTFAGYLVIADWYVASGGRLQWNLRPDQGSSSVPWMEIPKP